LRVPVGVPVGVPGSELEIEPKYFYFFIDSLSLTPENNRTTLSKVFPRGHTSSIFSEKKVMEIFLQLFDLK